MRKVFDVQPPKPANSAERQRFPAMGSTLSSQTGNPFSKERLSSLPLKPSRKDKWKKFTKRAGITLAIAVLAGGGWAGYKFIQNADKLFGGNVFGLLTSERLKGEDRGRVNILLSGYSADDPDHGGADLTDSIMVVSLDTQNNTAFMLSIPRDLWVEIPERGYQKINAAYKFGKADDFSSSRYNGGMGLLASIIDENFGLRIDYHALIDYTAFKDAVNAVGGITVNIASDDPRGLYDGNIARADGGPLDLENGLQDLDGQTALNLARARGSTWNSYGFAQSDFTRTEHQRMMLVALKKKVMSAGTLSNPIKLGKLFDSVGKNVQTDFKTSEARRLGEILKKIPDSSIKSISLNDVDGKGKNLLQSYRSPSGQSALIPAAGFDDYTDIASFIKTLTDVEPASAKPTETTTTTN